MPARLLSLIAALWIAAAVAGCSLGPGGSNDEGAHLTATRDFGARTLVSAREESIPGGQTVLRFLSREADVETRYGGRFVNAIEGVRSDLEGGRQRDWFYFVNGIEADVGAAERKVSGGDRVWWDYRDWSAAMRVPAVVGSYPEPFLSGSEGKRFPVRLDCAENAQDECRDVAGRLDRAGVAPSIAGIGAVTGKNVLRILVGEWADVRGDAAAREIEEGPRKSGVFARPARGASGYEIDLLDAQGRVVRRLGAGAGIVAAARFEGQQPTWVVSGTDVAGLERAVRLVGVSTLRDRFAVATAGQAPISLPVRSGAR
jgi:hypothetical protein